MLLVNFHLNFSSSVIMLNLSLCDSLSVNCWQLKKIWHSRLMMFPTFGFLFLFWWIWIFSTSTNFPFSTFFFFLFVTMLWDSCFLLAKESFSSFLCLSWLTRIGLCSPLSLFSPSCTRIDLSPESLSLIKIFSGVQYRISIRLLKTLKRRYLVYDDLSSFRISGQNWKRNEGMGSSIIKGPRL